MSRWYIWLSWSWEHGCPKHVEYRNKYIRKELCVKLVIYKIYTEMNGQQNIKSRILTRHFSKTCSSTPVAFTSATDILGPKVRSSLLLSFRLFSKSPYRFRTCGTTTTSSPHASNNSQWISMRQKCFDHENRITLWTFSRDQVSKVFVSAPPLIP